MVVIKCIKYTFVESLLERRYRDTMVSTADIATILESLLSNGRDIYESNNDINKITTNSGKYDFFIQHTSELWAKINE